MDNLLADSFLVKSYLTRKFSKYPTDYQATDFQTIIADATDARANYVNSLPLDKRAVAVSTDYYIHREALMHDTTPGWFEMQDMIYNHYLQMVISLIKPKNALLFSLENVSSSLSYLCDIQCDLTVFNTYLNKFYHDFWKSHPEYELNFNYNIIDIQELSLCPDVSAEQKFDFIHFNGIVLSWENDLLDKLIELLAPGGVLYLMLTNDVMRLYGSEYFTSPVYWLHENLSNRNDVYNFHIPDSVGFNIIQKK